MTDQNTETVTAVATYQDGATKEAVVGPKAHVMIERYFDRGMGDLFVEGQAPRMEYAYYMVWAALVAAGKEASDNYDGWLGEIETVRLDAPDEEQGKDESQGTRKAQSRNKSST